MLFVSADEEPKTSQVDEIVKEIKSEFTYKPSGIIGIGGGTILDLAKAVAIMLTNEGSASDYQGWDLVPIKLSTMLVFQQFQVQGQRFHAQPYSRARLEN